MLETASQPIKIRISTLTLWGIGGDQPVAGAVTVDVEEGAKYAAWKFENEEAAQQAYETKKWKKWRFEQWIYASESRGTIFDCCWRIWFRTGLRIHLESFGGSSNLIVAVIIAGIASAFSRPCTAINPSASVLISSSPSGEETSGGHLQEFWYSALSRSHWAPCWLLLAHSVEASCSVSYHEND